MRVVSLDVFRVSLTSSVACLPAILHEAHPGFRSTTPRSKILSKQTTSSLMKKLRRQDDSLLS